MMSEKPDVCEQAHSHSSGNSIAPSRHTNWKHDDRMGVCEAELRCRSSGRGVDGLGFVLSACFVSSGIALILIGSVSPLVI